MKIHLIHSLALDVKDLSRIRRLADLPLTERIDTQPIDVENIFSVELVEVCRRTIHFEIHPKIGESLWIGINMDYVKDNLYGDNKDQIMDLIKEQYVSFLNQERDKLIEAWQAQG
jgi:hypothetical protein